MRTTFLLCLALILSLCGARADLVNGIYVIVNDSVITYQEVEQSLAGVAELLYKQYRDQPQMLEQKLQQARADRIEELVQRELILNEFKTGGYVLPDSIIDDVIRERIKERYGDRATLTKTLQAQGMTFDGFRKQVREDYIVGAMVSQKLSSEKILVSPQKIENFYNEHQADFKVSDRVKLRMISLNKSKDNPDAAKKLAEEIHTKLKEGASFADMASIYSDAYKDKGGDRGWIERSFLKKELSDVAFGLKPNQFSDVIESGDAYYLLLVEQNEGAHTRPLADVRDEIEKSLKAQERTALRDRWIERLKTKSFIRYF